MIAIKMIKNIDPTLLTTHCEKFVRSGLDSWKRTKHSNQKIIVLLDIKYARAWRVVDFRPNEKSNLQPGPKLSIYIVSSSIE